MKNNNIIRTLVIIFIYSIFTYSCKNTRTDNVNITTEKLFVDTKFAELYTIKSVYSGDERIKLSSSDSSLMGMILDFKMSENRFYILTFDGFIFSFTKEGELIYRINRKGKGPMEYVNAMSLWPDPDDNYIKIVDRGGKSVLVLDSLGRYLSRWDMDLYAMKLIEYDGLNYVMDGGAANYSKNRLFYNQLFVFDNQFDLKARFLSTNKIMCNIGIGDRLDIIPVEGKVRARVLYNDTVYSINKQNDKIQIIPKYLMDFGKNAIPNKIFKNNSNITLKEFRQICIQKKYIYDIYRYLETKDYIFFSFKQEKKTYLYFYSKIKKKSKIVKDLLIPFEGYKYKRNIKYSDLPYITDGKCFYFIIEPSDYIKEMENIKKNLAEKEWEKFKKENQKYYEFVSGLTLLNNPVIVKRKINSEMFDLIH